jgi:hypothetical protein
VNRFTVKQSVERSSKCLHALKGRLKFLFTVLTARVIHRRTHIAWRIAVTEQMPLVTTEAAARRQHELTVLRRCLQILRQRLPDGLATALALEQSQVRAVLDADPVCRGVRA